MTAAGAPTSPTFPASSHSAKHATRLLRGFSRRLTRMPRRYGPWAKSSPLRLLRPAPCRPPEKPAAYPDRVKCDTGLRRLQTGPCRRGFSAGRAARRSVTRGCSTPNGVTAAWWPLRCQFGSARAGATSPLSRLQLATGRRGLDRSDVDRTRGEAARCALARTGGSHQA